MKELGASIWTYAKAHPLPMVGWTALLLVCLIGPTDGLFQALLVLATIAGALVIGFIAWIVGLFRRRDL